MSDYRWMVTQDHWMHDNCQLEGDNVHTVMAFSPLDAGSGIKMTHQWRCLDDDGIIYVEGIIGGEFSGFEPLDDWAGPNYGCTTIQYIDPESGDWNTL